MPLHVVNQTKLVIFFPVLDNCTICSRFGDIWRWKWLVRFPYIVFLYGNIECDVSKSYEQPVGFFLTCGFFTVIPYFCEIHCPANVIMMVANVLAPNRRQCIANHHRDSSSISGFTSSHQHKIHSGHQTNNTWGRSVSRQPVGSFVVDSGFVFLHG